MISQGSYSCLVISFITVTVLLLCSSIKLILLTRVCIVLAVLEVSFCLLTSSLEKSGDFICCGESGQPESFAEAMFSASQSS